MNSYNFIRSKSFYGFIFSMVGTFLISTNFITVKYSLKGFNSEAFSLIWTFGASLYSLILISISGNSKHLVLTKGPILNVILMGVSSGISMLFLWGGLAELDPSFASFLYHFIPVLSILMGMLFLNERLMLKEIVFVPLMVLGGFISSFGRWHIIGKGVTLTLLGCFFSALQMLLAKKVANQIHPYISNFYRLGIGVLIIALWTALTRRANFQVDISYWLVTFIGAFLGPFIGWVMIFKSYTYWNLVYFSLINTLQPLFVIPLAYFFLRRLPSNQELFGGLIILAGGFGVAWANVNRLRRRKVAEIP